MKTSIVIYKSDVNVISDSWFSSILIINIKFHIFEKFMM